MFLTSNRIKRVNVLFYFVGSQSAVTINLNDTDLWDDALLIKAYDESLKLAKEEVAKRIARATNTGAAASSDSETAAIQQQLSSDYKAGDYVRCTYAEDGIDYEAIIISIEDDQYLIKYVGYDNEEIVEAEALIPSWGKKARKKQMLAASASSAATVTSEHHRQPAYDDEFQQQIGHSQHYNRQRSGMMIPPPPPMPPMMEDMSEDSEHLSAMLMSWYMSGYYTGLYQGLKQKRVKGKH